MKLEPIRIWLQVTPKSHPAGVRGLKRLNPVTRSYRRKSHPAGVRGLKPLTGQDRVDDPGVAPRRGAWIETIGQALASSCFTVAPRRGAWIETPHAVDISLSHKVAPRRGAWIETLGSKLIFHLTSLSHPAGVRGLKPISCNWSSNPSVVAPRRGAWIET